MQRLSLIRKEDRESVFKAILLHHNYDTLKLVINVDAKKIFASSQSIHSHKSDVDHHLLKTPRPSIGSVKGINELHHMKRRASNVLHPSTTGLLNTRMFFGEEVRNKLWA